MKKTFRWCKSWYEVWKYNTYMLKFLHSILTEFKKKIDVLDE